MTRKIRLDELLVSRGMAADVRTAGALALSGRVFLGEQRLDKPGTLVAAGEWIQLRNAPPRYVSRGGFKLEAALAALQVRVRNRVCLDLGASTGGFTDCLLQHGAREVLALDVGKGQLEWKLRQDPRVVVLEGINARFLSPGHLPRSPELATADLAFISLRLILPRLELFQELELLLLVKPQFEAFQGEVEAGGVIRSPEKRREILSRFKDFVSSSEYQLKAEYPSPVRGRKGNRETFFHLRRHPD